MTREVTGLPVTNGMHENQKMRRGFVDGPFGQMFYRERGSGPAIVLVHQILRTSLDFRAAMLLLGRSYRVVAFDNVGCGDSDPPDAPCSLEEHAKALGMAMDALGLRDAVVVGHHSGANIALEICLQRSDLVRAVVLSGLFYVEDAAKLRELEAKALTLRDPPAKPNGSHLVELWNEGLRTNWGKPRFPPDRLDLLGEFFFEQYKTGPRRFEPYVAQMRHDTAARLPALQRPCLFISASDDVWMCNATDLWRRDQPKASFEQVEAPQGGELPRLHPNEWSAAILRFLAGITARTHHESGTSDGGR